MDAMASIASLVGQNFGPDEYRFVVQVLHSPAVSNQTQFDSLMYYAQIDSGEWFAHIFNYLKTGIFSCDAGKILCVQLWKLVAHYILLSNVLYRRSYNGLLLHCLMKFEIPLALQEAHYSSRGGHFKGKYLIHKLIHMGYYW